MPTTEKHLEAKNAAIIAYNDEVTKRGDRSEALMAGITAYLRSVLEGTEAALWAKGLRGLNVINRPNRDDLADLIEALTASLSEAQERCAGMEWQPVETAPLDTAVMLWWIPRTPNRNAECPVIGQISSHQPGHWWNGQRGEYQKLSHIAGWQPLPAALPQALPAQPPQPENENV